MPDTMTLTSADLIVVNGRPTFTFEAIAGFNPRSLQGARVVIDGQPYDVLAVETYAIIDATGTNFGLMVKCADE